MTVQHAPYNAPAPGRIRLQLQDVKLDWVDRFSTSKSRPELWQKFNSYLAKFAEIEETLQKDGHITSAESVVKYIWLGGSFISDKVEPNNLDLTVFIDGNTADKIKGKVGSGWINRHAFDRHEMSKKYHEFHGLTPIKVVHYPVKSIFHPSECTDKEIEYILDRGRWDDWLQRKRDTNTRALTLSSCETRRGYVEVQL